VDGDVFGRATRAGRNAADAASRALNGDAWDPFCANRCLDILIAAAGGVASLPSVLRELRNLNASPLLSRVLGEDASHRIAAAVADAKGGILDLILKSVVQRCVLRGVHNEREILTRFAAELLDRTIVTGRGGLLEHHGSERLPEIHALHLPVAADAAEVLQRRPDAKRLGLARRHACITPETDLLGGSK
jgi:hypothetical protein